MAIRKKTNKRIKNMTIKLESDKNILDIFLKPRIAIVRSPMIKELVRESNMQRDVEPHAKQIFLIKQLLNPGKIKILYILKHEKPNSIYSLAKMLGRDFKAVRQDLRILEQNGFVRLSKEKVMNRLCLKPVLISDKINFSIQI